MNVYSGGFTYNLFRAGRQSNAITYTSPDFNGFSFGLSGVLDGTGSVALDDPGPSDEDAAVDKFVTAAGYSFGGFNIAGTYVRQDILDINPTSVGLALGYGQDNWSLGYYYANTDFDVTANLEMAVHSFASQVDIGKSTLRALYETAILEADGVEDVDSDYWTLEAQYNLGSKSRVYVEYNRQELLNSVVDRNNFLVGYRVDF